MTDEQVIIRKWERLKGTERLIKYEVSRSYRRSPAVIEDNQARYLAYQSVLMILMVGIISNIMVAGWTLMIFNNQSVEEGTFFSTPIIIGALLATFLLGSEMKKIVKGCGELKKNRGKNYDSYRMGYIKKVLKKLGEI